MEDGRVAARRQYASPRRGISLPRRQRRDRRRYREFFRLRNSFDFTLLQPGDLVLVANPGDDAHAFVDAVNLPVRRAARRADRTLLWQRVRYTSLRAFQAYMDILVLRPQVAPETRQAAADFARAQVGKPFLRRIVAGMFLSRHPTRPVRRPEATPAGSGATPAGSSETMPGEFTCRP